MSTKAEITTRLANVKRTLQTMADQLGAELVLAAADVVALPEPAPIPEPIPPVVVIPPAPVEPPVTTVPGSNEPTGCTRVVEMSMDTPSGFTRGVSFTRFGGYGTVTYPRGFTSGGSVPNGGLIQHELGNRHSVMYLRQRIGYSANWFGHESGVNKMSYLYGTNFKPYFVTLARGAGTGILTHAIATQHMVTAPPWLMPNVGPSGEVPRGRDVVYEYVVTLNTAGMRNGRIEAWMNGVKTHDHTGLQFTTGATTWEYYEWAPVWGGVGGPNVPAEQWQRMDYLYLSGK